MRSVKSAWNMWGRFQVRNEPPLCGASSSGAPGPSEVFLTCWPSGANGILTYWCGRMLSFAGCVTAARLGIPHAAVQVATYRPYLHELIAPKLDRLCAIAGLPPAPPGEMLNR